MQFVKLIAEWAENALECAHAVSWLVLVWTFGKTLVAEHEFPIQAAETLILFLLTLVAWSLAPNTFWERTILYRLYKAISLSVGMDIFTFFYAGRAVKVSSRFASCTLVNLAPAIQALMRARQA